MGGYQQPLAKGTVAEHFGCQHHAVATPSARPPARSVARTVPAEQTHFERTREAHPSYTAEYNHRIQRLFYLTGMNRLHTTSPRLAYTFLLALFRLNDLIWV